MKKQRDASITTITHTLKSSDVVRPLLLAHSNSRAPKDALAKRLNGASTLVQCRQVLVSLRKACRVRTP